MKTANEASWTSRNTPAVKLRIAGISVPMGSVRVSLTQIDECHCDAGLMLTITKRKDTSVNESIFTWPPEAIQAAREALDELEKKLHQDTP